VIGRLLAGLKIEDLAKTLGKQPGAVRVSQFRALRALAEHLGLARGPGRKGSRIASQAPPVLPGGCLTLNLDIGYEQYLKVMTNMPIGHPFRRQAAWGELPLPLLLAPIAKGRSYFCVKCYTTR
jgi:hypothetical protein